MTTPDYPAVLRYQVSIGGANNITVPQSHTVLSCAPARDSYCIDVWIQTSPIWTRQVSLPFHVVGTGHPLPEYFNMRFVGTCVMVDGLVWHLYVGEPS